MVSGGGSHGGKKELNFDLNLVPFMDLLSVCIYFLLLSAVWIQLGAVPVKQAIGGQPSEGKTPNPSINVKIEPSGDLALSFKNPPKGVKGAMSLMVKSQKGQMDFDAAATHLKAWKSQVPDLSMAIFQPAAQTVYQDLVQLMDRFREAGVKDLGVAPL